MLKLFLISILIIFCNSQNDVKMLISGDLFSSTIDYNMSKYKWFGIFENSIKRVELTTSFYAHPIFEEDSTSAVKIRSKPDKPYFLISEFNGLNVGQMK